MSARHDAVALASYLLWKNPLGHEVSEPLPREDYYELVKRVARADADDADTLDGVLTVLSEHAPRGHVTELLATLERLVRVGDGCIVASHAPPRLEGAVPDHLRVVWDRVPALVAAGHLQVEREEP